MKHPNDKPPLIVGCVYYRKVGGRASVRKIIGIDATHITYEHLWGPQFVRLKQGGGTLVARTRIRNFNKWVTDRTRHRAQAKNFSFLDGAKIDPTYIVENTKGVPILRCSERRAKFYLRKGYAVVIADHRLKFTNDQTENRLLEVHGSLDNPFFMEVKNDRCCCCNTTDDLSRHHVIPQRLKKLLPREIKDAISNVVFICRKCHSRYEDYASPMGRKAWTEPVLANMTPVDYVNAWNDHFMEMMKPEFLPKGWKIWTVAPPKFTSSLPVV